MSKKVKFLTSLIWLVSLALVLVLPTAALRQRTRRKTTSSPGTTSASRGVKAQIRFRSDRQGLLISFSDFEDIDSVRYELVYDSNGVTQAVGGTAALGDTSTRELLFGTCSAGICRYHSNITNARLSIITTLENGTKILKPYRIRV
jgi:hypothetical protein